MAGQHCQYPAQKRVNGTLHWSHLAVLVVWDQCVAAFRRIRLFIYARQPSVSDRSIEATRFAGVAGWTGGVGNDPQRILVAIDANVANLQNVAGGFALPPEFAA